MSEHLIAHANVDAVEGREILLSIARDTKARDCDRIMAIDKLWSYSIAKQKAASVGLVRQTYVFVSSVQQAREVLRNPGGHGQPALNEKPREFCDPEKEIAFVRRPLPSDEEIDAYEDRCVDIE